MPLSSASREVKRDTKNVFGVLTRNRPLFEPAESKIPRTTDWNRDLSVQSAPQNGLGFQRPSSVATSQLSLATGMI